MIPPALPLPSARAFVLALSLHVLTMVPTVAWMNLGKLAALALLASSKADLNNLARKARRGAWIYAGYPAARWYRSLACVLFCAARSIDPPRPPPFVSPGPKRRVSQTVMEKL